MKHVQSVTIILKNGRQVVIVSKPGGTSGNPHGADVGGGTCTSLPNNVIGSLLMDTRAMDLNLDFLHKKSKG